MDTFLIPEGPAVTQRRMVQLLFVRQTLRFDEAMGHINTEAINPAVQPKGQDRSKELPHFRIFPIEVRLAGVKEV